MKNSLKQDFTRRINHCNKSELVVIMYDIFFAYTQEAKDAHAAEDRMSYKLAIRNAQNAIDSLTNALNFQYEISKNLLQLYVYCKNLLAKAMYQNKIEPIEEAEELLKRLYTSFCEVAKTDTSGPLMKNTQQVYAGYTYGRTSLNESLINDDHRGFFV